MNLSGSAAASFATTPDQQCRCRDRPNSHPNDNEPLVTLTAHASTSLRRKRAARALTGRQGGDADGLVQAGVLSGDERRDMHASRKMLRWVPTLAVSRHRQFACAIVIDTKDRFLFQRRDNIPEILLPGMICLFGGHREGDETFLQCIVRELHEELMYFTPPERCEHLGSHHGLDIDLGYGTADCEFYLVRDIPADEVNVTEGSLLIVERETWQSLTGLAPFAQAAIRLFIDRLATA
jgi:8-oxo-dGTP pyrophosphatase MutT (NUDIX family)